MLLNHVKLVGALSGGLETQDGAVRVQDGRITAVYGTPAEPDDEGQLDCGGRTLTPGLIDLHTHFTGLLGYSGSDVLSPMKVLTMAAQAAPRYLDFGFTTIRDCGSVQRAANYVRDLAESGTITAPHILSGGLILSPTEIERADAIYEMYSFGDGADSFRRMARCELAEHADFVKIMASGAAFHPQGVPKHPIIAPDELREAVETAARKGTYVAAHAHADAAIRDCIRAGVRTIEHATYLSEETLEELERTPGCYLVPTLSAMFVSGSDETGFWHKRLGAMLDACCKGLQAAYARGLKIGFGTDSMAGMRQYSEGIEFRYRKDKCRMKDLDILLQATVISAEIAGLPDRGEICAGMRADMVLWERDPSQDIMAAAEKPAAVWLDGRLVRENK